MKFFGIGLSRTGTTSFHVAMALLGKSSIHYHQSSALRWIRGDFEPNTTDGFDVISDIPTCTFFKQLDATHPGSKFVLTTRTLDGWLSSMEEHYERSIERSADTFSRDLIRVAVYGIDCFHKARMTDVFKRHHDDVLSYFDGRPGDLMTFDVNEPDPWAQLCAFTQTERPSFNYPKLSTPQIGTLSVIRSGDLQRKMDTLRQLLGD